MTVAPTCHAMSGGAATKHPVGYVDNGGVEALLAGTGPAHSWGPSDTSAVRRCLSAWRKAGRRGAQHQRAELAAETRKPTKGGGC
jgi:hypothetical protein